MAFASRINQELGRYHVLELLGEGGMGEVYRARDEQLHRDVAIKTLRDGTASRTRLLREARAAAALNHPHICTIHEVCEAGGDSFIVMEFVQGRPLSSEVRARKAGRAGDPLRNPTGGCSHSGP